MNLRRHCLQRVRILSLFLFSACAGLTGPAVEWELRSPVVLRFVEDPQAHPGALRLLVRTGDRYAGCGPLLAEMRRTPAEYILKIRGVGYYEGRGQCLDGVFYLTEEFALGDGGGGERTLRVRVNRQDGLWPDADLYRITVSDSALAVVSISGEKEVSSFPHSRYYRIQPAWVWGYVSYKAEEDEPLAASFADSLLSTEAERVPAADGVYGYLRVRRGGIPYLVQFAVTDGVVEKVRRRGRGTGVPFRCSSTRGGAARSNHPIS